MTVTYCDLHLLQETSIGLLLLLENIAEFPQLLSVAPWFLQWFTVGRQECVPLIEGGKFPEIKTGLFELKMSVKQSHIQILSCYWIWIEQFHKFTECRERLIQVLFRIVIHISMTSLASAVSEIFLSSLKAELFSIILELTLE